MQSDSTMIYDIDQQLNNIEVYKQLSYLYI